MALVVQKFGGTSVADIECIKKIAVRIKAAYDQGDEVIVVVSARSGVTNELIARARQLSAEPDQREMDMLLSIGEQETIALTAMALHGLGVPAVSRTGPQVGIVTEGPHCDARIAYIQGGDVLEQLKAGRVVIVAGFQGVNEAGDITTLGRGSSDLTAVALATAFEAQRCEIYTDVEGVYECDPNCVQDPRKWAHISPETMLELAGSGAQVVQARAVQLAGHKELPLWVRSAFVDKAGTLIASRLPSALIEESFVRGITIDTGYAKILLERLERKPGIAASLFEALQDAGISIGTVHQGEISDALINITLTVPLESLHSASSRLKALLEDMGSGRVAAMGPIAKLSVVGTGLRFDMGIAATLCRVLAKEAISIELLSVSETKISAVIPVAVAQTALRLVHEALSSSVSTKEGKDAIVDYPAELLANA